MIIKPKKITKPFNQYLYDLNEMYNLPPDIDPRKDNPNATQELNDYAHMVSHDLKSPLRSIDALTSWLKDDYEGKFDANFIATHGIPELEKLGFKVIAVL